MASNDHAPDGTPAETPANRWLAVTGGTRGPAYAARFRELAAQGRDLHGEARFCDALLPRGARVLDAGCGTGRVAVELARLGHRTVGTDIDASMLGEARAAAPELDWVLGDLAVLDPAEVGGAGTFDLAVAAGNVMVYLTPGTEKQAVATLAACVRPGGGLVVAGFALDGGESGTKVPAADYEAACAAAGLEPVGAFAGWDREPWDPDGEYGVFVHRRP
ncbi:class I SAM-dependent methyltransferase [Yinghuangia soli]|uniref:Class I SAM-dependent methyltransferase n=1 Tax=Yinghuangia soli TaxID=2908204 RepID=A0AA41Q835_9ACTN|nr:class I SAM-dependent methyltransferase [Yinghuangia soli]MCF2532946.1 class I SAM-dependent methyltransferase [Yinghuangia soli]